jgi:hypothetical protein
VFDEASGGLTLIAGASIERDESPFQTTENGSSSGTPVTAMSATSATTYKAVLDEDMA